MRNLLTLIIVVFLFSCNEEKPKGQILEPVEFYEINNDSITFKNGLNISETIPNPKVEVTFVDSIDSLSILQSR